MSAWGRVPTGNMYEQYDESSMEKTWYDGMNENDKLVFFGYPREGTPIENTQPNNFNDASAFDGYRSGPVDNLNFGLRSNTVTVPDYGYSQHDGYGNASMFNQYRNTADGLSLDGKTIAASEYSTSFETTDTSTTDTFYSPYEGVSGNAVAWPVRGDQAPDQVPDQATINAMDDMVRDFYPRTSIRSARSSPRIMPQLDLDEFEGSDLLTFGSPKGVATIKGLAETPSSLDNVGKERFKELERHVQKYTKILDTPEFESREEQGKGGTILASRARERPQLATVFEHRPAPRFGQGRETTTPNYETHRQNNHREGNYFPPTNIAAFNPQGAQGGQGSQGILRDHGRRRMGHPDPSRAGPRKRARAQHVEQPLEPKPQAHPTPPASEANYPRTRLPHLPKRDSATRPGNGQFKCTIDGCTKAYTLSENLCRHLRDHKGNPNLVLKCPECPSQRRGVRAHENMKTHLREKHKIF
ncbi:hypothetical protein TWF718_007879 [Orbilia javanica]|uniref:C2H2-type domain-containing protein n=1 Tax=Orbilia javanica TaxID=47235 RepID=A0AAN8RGU3_9PEZI